MLRAAALLIAAALLSPCASALSACRAAVLDADTGEVCFARNASEHALIASTTKIMTGLLIAEDCDPDAVVTVPQEAVGIEGSSLYLKAGEQLTVRALLYGLLLHSGNDAAVALALAHSGSVGAFVEAMNGRARELGLQDTVRGVGFDNNVVSVGMLETGEVDTLIVQNSYAMGYLGVETAYKLINGYSIKDTIYTDTIAVDKENMYDEECQRRLFAFEKSNKN